MSCVAIVFTWFYISLILFIPNTFFWEKVFFNKWNYGVKVIDNLAPHVLWLCTIIINIDNIQFATLLLCFWYHGANIRTPQIAWEILNPPNQLFIFDVTHIMVGALWCLFKLTHHHGCEGCSQTKPPIIFESQFMSIQPY